MAEFAKEYKLQKSTAEGQSEKAQGFTVHFPISQLHRQDLGHFDILKTVMSGFQDSINVPQPT